MKVETIVTLEGTDKYYLADETIQNGIQYFLATKLTENDELGDESCIFEVIPDGEDFYLDEVKEAKLKNFLTAVFTSNFISEVDEM
jgi:hypothetical protein